ESAGIAVSNGSQILVFKDMGLVSQVFDETSLGSLQGHIAVAHPRYSTTGASAWENAQPTFPPTAPGSTAPGPNRHPARPPQRAADGEPVTVEQAAHVVLPLVKGAFSLVFMDEGTLYAARAPQGIRPLVLGRLERGWVVASESAALDICGASFVREIEPGEFV